MNCLLVDDHPIIRNSLGNIIRSHFSAIKVFEANNYWSAQEQLKKTNFEICILDLNMPGISGLKALRLLNCDYPDLKILIFSMNDEELYSSLCIENGAKGFVTKLSDIQIFIEAFDKILSNRIYINDQLINKYFQSKHKSEDSDPFKKLSARENQVINLLLQGYSLKEIADQLNLVYSTVSTFRNRVYKKLKINSILQLIEVHKLYRANDAKQELAVPSNQKTA